MCKTATSLRNPGPLPFWLKLMFKPKGTHAKWGLRAHLPAAIPKVLLTRTRERRHGVCTFLFPFLLLTLVQMTQLFDPNLSTVSKPWPTSST